MNPHIAASEINLLEVLRGKMEFLPHLNLISGENGTLKTKLLQYLKNGTYVSEPVGSALRIYAINPRRNAIRREVEQIFQNLRRGNQTLATYTKQSLGIVLDDNSFHEYPSIGDLFVLIYENYLRDGGDQQVHMKTVREELNETIASVFPKYNLLAEWDHDRGRPQLSLMKGPNITVPINALSLGEQEVLSLITNIYAMRNSIDVLLEPFDKPAISHFA